MAPKKRGRPAKVKREDLDTAPFIIDDADDEPPPKKVKVDVDELFQSPIKKQSKDAQVARTQGLAIPVDTECPLSCKWNFGIIKKSSNQREQG
jgi:hypothetical protein